MKNKKCNKCHESKPLSQFYRSENGYKGNCIVCYLKEQSNHTKRRTGTERIRRLKRAAYKHIKNENSSLLNNTINKILILI